MNNPTIIYIVRHGEVDWNKKKLVLGQTDRPLNVEGKEQAMILKHKFKNIHFDAVYSSDLERSRETAQIIVGQKNIDIKTTKTLREQSFGKYEGWKKKDFLKLFDKWEQMTNEEKHTYTLSKDMESNKNALIRFTSFLTKVSKSHNGEKVLIVTHGALMRYLLIYLNYSTYDHISYFDNTGYIRLKSCGGNFLVNKLCGFHKS